MLKTNDDYIARKARLFPNITEEQWNDWRWQVKHRVTDAKGLKQFIPLTPQEEQEMEDVLGRFRIAITPYYLSLIDPEDPNDPIRKQAVPGVAELTIGSHDMADPLDEDKDSPVPGLTHTADVDQIFMIGQELDALVESSADRIGFAESQRRMGMSKKAEGRPLVLQRGRCGKTVKDITPHVRVVHRGMHDAETGRGSSQKNIALHRQVAQPGEFLFTELLACPLDSLGSLQVKADQLAGVAGIGVMVAHNYSKQIKAADNFQAFTRVGIVTDNVPYANIFLTTKALCLVKNCI